MFTVFVVFVIVVSRTESIHGELCLGIPGACDLSLNEITLAGAHNAGSGFDGLLMYHTSFFAVPALSCPYRNQKASVYQMLNVGIRFFDIDLCYESSSKYGIGLWTCHNGAFGGKMSKFFDQVDRWMNEERNRNEIVVLQFNRDYEKDERENIKRSLAQELKARWDPAVGNGKLSMQTAWWRVKLGTSIRNNQRIYVFVNENIRNSKERFLFPAGYIGYTWKSMAYLGSNDCKDLANAVSDNCKIQAKDGYYFIRLDLTLTWGLCNDDLAKICNRHIDYSTKKCYENIRSVNRNVNTVNFIVTDYSHRYPGTNAVKTAKEITLNYIRNKKESGR